MLLTQYCFLSRATTNHEKALTSSTGQGFFMLCLLCLSKHPYQFASPWIFAIPLVDWYDPNVQIQQVPI